MNGIPRNALLRRTGCVAVLFLSITSLHANPIAETPDIFEYFIFVPVTLAIFVEVFCVSLILKRGRHPRLFVLWLMGMHLVTYPLFLFLLWLGYGLHPVGAVALGEGIIILVEGGFIYLMCRYLPAAGIEGATPTITKTILASLIGNLCSMVAYPIILMVCIIFVSLFGRGQLD